MKNTELRLNNWISAQFDERKEIQVNVNNIEQLVNHGNEMIMKGIPISEEWLLKFGFEKNTNKENMYYIRIYKYTLFSVYLHDDCFSVFLINRESTVSLSLDYNFVHQLQNLFYSITQTELDIK